MYPTSPRIRCRHSSNPNPRHKFMPLGIPSTSIPAPLTEEVAAQLGRYKFTFESTGKPWSELAHEAVDLLWGKYEGTLAPPSLPLAGQSQHKSRQAANSPRQGNVAARDFRIPKDAMGKAKKYKGKKMSQRPEIFVVWLAEEVRMSRLQRASWAGLLKAIAFHHPRL
ncbi:hypothetical protein K458DRAFT_77527 [Lentithecium fluviatile CBS 122367]|uniref:Uncharacterized protein n=1 Tax=Lentithecium fluviatile CBS 122367 TaxID=1168545 RepID=A0A6G1IU36_9PLEO|nr:hypothetical protein K458DRAFT_77527 [Lentithecium fluviatile CBS 122367]